MQQALERVRADLGQDAVILNTRTVRRAFLGIPRKPHVEIFASVDARVTPRVPRPPAARPRSAPPPSGDRPGACADPAVPRAVLEELAALRTHVDHLVAEGGGGSSFPTPLRAHYRHLVDRGVNAALARRLLRRIHDGFSAAEQADALKVRLQLIEDIRAAIPVHGRIPVRATGPTVIGLLGPTGVGKTTTIAKLAAQYALSDRRTVGLITADTYRIAAVEQLRVYAEIIDVPLEVAMTPGEMRAALARFHDRDVVLIDTPGRSPQDTTSLAELRALVEAARPDHAALCVSATTHADEVPNIVARFGVVPPQSLILTKLDETLHPGWVLNTCAALATPVTYVTTGQNVPDDIEVADSTRLVSRILGDEAAV